MTPDEPDELFEMKMVKQFPVSAARYFMTQTVETFGSELPVFSLEGGYTLMKHHFPHYLGSREKYSLTSGMIERSGLLDPETVDGYRRIFQDCEITHTPVRELDFTLDRIQDPATFRGQKNVASVHNTDVFYPALLFEDMHFKRGNP
jgi:hypothetical protein